MFENQYVVAGLMNSVGAVVFVLGVGFVPEPYRRRAMVILLAYAAGVHFSDPIAPFGLLASISVAITAGIGLVSYRAIAVGWMVHGLWDLVLYSQGHGLVGLDPMTALGCAIFDPLIAIWFWFNAPHLLELWFQSIQSKKQSP